MKLPTARSAIQAVLLLFFVMACLEVIYLSSLPGMFNHSLDWPKEWSSYRLLVESAWTYGEFPWISYGMRPYYLPCYFTLFNPENGYFSLLTPIFLGLGHFFLAFWISLAVHMTIGGFAFYHLMIRLGSGRLPTLLFLTAFLFGSWPLAHFSVGHLTWQTWYLFPVCFDLLHRGMEAFRKRQPYFRFLVITGIVHAVILYEGGQHIWVMSGLALGLFALLGLGLNPGWRWAAGFVGLQGVAMAAFAAPKLFPILMFFPAYTSKHDYAIEAPELFDIFLNLSFANWEKDFFIGYPALAVLLATAFLWPLRGRWRARPDAREGLMVEDRRALSALVLLFFVFALWPWREWFDAIPGLRTQGVRARFLSLSLFFGMILCGRSFTLALQATFVGRAGRVGVGLALVVLIGLNIWSLKEKVSLTHSRFWVPGTEFQPGDPPMQSPEISAWDGHGNTLPAVVEMRGGVDFDVVWTEGPPAEEAVLILPRFPFGLYRNAFESPGSTVIDRGGWTAFTHLQSIDGRTSFRYTLYHEKVGVLAFILLTGLLAILYRLTPMYMRHELRPAD